jgi:hypothetical protein
MAGKGLGILRLVGLLAAVMACGTAAAEDVSITGRYVQKRACRGDGNDPERLLVIIGADEIKYGGGTCLLTDKHPDGDKLSARATCKFRSGRILSGNITLTKRADNNLDMVDPEGTYATVLYRCPHQ